MKKIILVISMMILLTGCKINNKEDDNDLNIGENVSIKDNSITLEVGKYFTVNEIIDDEAGVSNESVGILLKENNQFEIYMGWGFWHSGTYEIKNNILVCKSTLLAWEWRWWTREKRNGCYIFI